MSGIPKSIRKLSLNSYFLKSDKYPLDVYHKQQIGYYKKKNRMGKFKNGLSMRFLMCLNADYSVIANRVSEDSIFQNEHCISKIKDCILQDEDCKSERKIAKFKRGLQTCCHESFWW